MLKNKKVFASAIFFLVAISGITFCLFKVGGTYAGPVNDIDIVLTATFSPASQEFTDITRTCTIYAGSSSNYCVLNAPEVSYNHDGFILKNWITSNSDKGSCTGNTCTIYDNVTFYANWDKEIKGTFKGNGGTLNGNTNPGCHISFYGQPCNISAPSATRPGYIFSGWSASDEDGSCDGNNCKIYEDIIFTAQWVAAPTLSVTATFKGNGGTLSGNTSPSCNLDDNYCTVESPTITAAPSNKKFKEWSVSPSTNGDCPSVTSCRIKGDVTITAIWEDDGSAPSENQYVATFQANGGTIAGNNIINCPVVQSSSKCYVTAPQVDRQGYTFNGWKANPTSSYCTLSNGQCTLTTDTIFTAQWVKNETTERSLKASFYKESSGTSGESIVKSCNLSGSANYCTITAPTVTRTGYSFIKWNGTPSTANCTGNICKIYADSVFNAQWKENDSASVDIITIKFYHMDKDNKIQAITINKGTNITNVPIPTYEGHTFIHWSSNPNACDIEFSLEQNLYSSISLYACYEINEVVNYYTVTFDSNEGKFVNGDITRSIIIDSDTKLIEPEVNPIKTGYKFEGWYNNGHKYSFNNKVSSDIKLTARYIKDNSLCTYTCDKNDLYDPSIGKCISISNNDNNLTFDLMYSYNLSCINGKFEVSNKNCVGDCHNNFCSDDYKADLWLISDTCHANSSCTVSSSNCSKEYKGYCYKTYEVEKFCVNDENNLADIEVSNNNKTGDVLIYFVLIIGLGSLVYLIYYIHKKKKKEE